MKSERGIKIFVDESIVGPYLTMEDYEKWYSAYVIFPSGTVLKYWPGKRVEDLLECKSFMNDHEIRPDNFRLAAKLEGWSVCEAAAKAVEESWKCYCE